MHSYWLLRLFSHISRTQSFQENRQVRVVRYRSWAASYIALMTDGQTHTESSLRVTANARDKWLLKFLGPFSPSLAHARIFCEGSGHQTRWGVANLCMHVMTCELHHETGSFDMQ